MKAKKLAKLRINMWIYLIVFTIIIIAILWIFQILMFDNVYQRKKLETLESTGEKLSSQLNGELNDASMSQWLTTAIDANEDGIFSYLVYYDDLNGYELSFESIYTGFFDNGNGLKNNSTQNSQSQNSSDDVNSSNSSIKPPLRTDVGSTEYDKDKNLINDAIKQLVKTRDAKFVSYRYSDDDNYEYYVYITRIQNELIGDKGGYLVLKTSQVSLNETVQVIQQQLIIVTLFVTIISFFLAWFISLKLSKPITDMSDTAKKWAEGDDKVVFNGQGYDELKELADTLNNAKDEISKTGVLQRDLLANVSHDLKTPLTMIKAYAEMIRDLSGNIKEKRDLHTKVIIDEADRLTMLVNDILDLSKLQNGVNELEITTVNLSELCESVVYQFNEFAKSNGYLIENEIDADLFVQCDERKMKQVLYNLIGNSINYTGEDKHILVKLSKKDERIVFESIDSGKGISEENMKTIWEKYYRFSETHHRPIKGTGLGLSIVKTILEAHRLKFGVISKIGVGSNFFIEFKEAEIE